MKPARFDGSEKVTIMLRGISQGQPASATEESGEMRQGMCKVRGAISRSAKPEDWVRLQPLRDAFHHIRLTSSLFHQILKPCPFDFRIFSASLLALALIFCAHGAAGQGAAETIEVDFSNPAAAPSHWSITLHPDGNGYFSSYGGGTSGSNSDLKAPPVNREIQLSQEFTRRLFETAYHQKLFNEKCESNLKVAFQGEKTLSYKGYKGNGSCSFNYSKDREIQDLSDSMQAVEQTIIEGARLELLLKHDPLGLDEEMNFLVQAAKDGRAQQICAIKAILVQLANDPGVLDAVRRRADLLLQNAKI